MSSFVRTFGLQCISQTGLVDAICSSCSAESTISGNLSGWSAPFKSRRRTSVMALASKSGFMKQLRVQLVTTRERTRGRKEGLLMVILGGRTTSILIMKGSSQSTTNWCYHCITQGLRMPTTYRSSFSRLATSNHMIQNNPVLPEASISLRDR